jgi:glycosyltransferase involved in cell wall biosynthesis
MVVLSHPTGNSNVRAVGRGLVEAGLLTEFHTTIGTFPGDFLDRIGGIGLLSELRRRRFDTALKSYTRLSPWLELGRFLGLKLGISALTKHEIGLFSVDAVYRHLDQQVATSLAEAVKRGAKAVYAYEDGALETFKAAKQLGLACIYDLPIAYWETGRQLMMEEALRLPAWADTLGGGITDSAQKLERKRQELQLADLVITPSQFVADLLPAWAKQKKRITAPFGSPATLDVHSVSLSQSKPSGPLRVLFVGSMGQRKGLADLFAAIKLINRPEIELVILGSLQAPIEFYRAELPAFTYEPGRPHNQVLELMRSCDVFCLPSIVEGRALVLQEAMSQGLPLIITPNTGGDDLIIEGKTGFLVPIRSPERIAEKLIWLLDNRAVIPEMGRLAQRHAAQYTWENYQTTIVEAIIDLLR